MNHSLLYKIAQNTAGTPPAVGDGIHALAWKIAQNTAGASPAIGDGIYDLLYKIARNTAGTLPKVGDSPHDLLHKIAGNTNGLRPAVGDGTSNLLYKIAENTAGGTAPPAIPIVPVNANRWADTVTAKGGTYSPATLTALRALDNDLILFGIDAKLVYFNPRCGSDLIAARVPMIAKNGPGFDIPDSSPAWSEPSGLVGISMDTGVNPNASVSLAGASLGIYALNDASSNYPVIGDWTAPPGFFQLFLNQFGPAGYEVFDAFDSGGGGRVQTSDTTDGAKTKGLMCGSRVSAQVSTVFRNGVIRGITASSTNPAPNGVTTAHTLVDSRQGTSGGDFIGLALSNDDVSNLTWIMHTFNKALGRGVVAEGMP